MIHLSVGQYIGGGGGHSVSDLGSWNECRKLQSEDLELWGTLVGRGNIGFLYGPYLRLLRFATLVAIFSIQASARECRNVLLTEPVEGPDSLPHDAEYKEGCAIADDG
jgi:hypothetical protein